jgi:hypothetical protein
MGWGRSQSELQLPSLSSPESIYNKSEESESLSQALLPEHSAQDKAKPIFKEKELGLIMRFCSFLFCGHSFDSCQQILSS